MLLSTWATGSTQKAQGIHTAPHLLFRGKVTVQHRYLKSDDAGNPGKIREILKIKLENDFWVNKVDMPRKNVP